MADASIEALNLTKSYGSFTALSDLNIRMDGSKCVGFLGPNGAGKTTTLKIFTDLVKPTKGSALINGIDVHEDKKKALAECSALIETPEIYPSMTVREALNLVADLRGVPKSERKDQVESVVAEVKMEEWIDKKVGKFSKGMKQRINIASTLIGNPSIIMLDEPTSGLDPRGMAEVREIVKSLKKKDRLIFMSSHLLNEVADVCDEVAMIDHGKLLAFGTLEEVTSKFSRVDDTVEAQFANPIEDDTIKVTISGLNSVTSVERVDSRTVRIKFKGGTSVQENLLEELASLKIGLISFKSTSTKLEDSYLALFKETT
ncbi:MAG: ABC transporter ATP-binding protein [Thermoplasmataceae archaeon]